MKVTLGKDGLDKTWQNNFPKTTECCRCGGESRIGFVAQEMDDGRPAENYVCNLHPNDPPDNLWLHDVCSVAIYFCRKCLQPTALYNQA